MSRQRYIPDRGDLVWLDFRPQAGREQAGRRPAVVVSPKTYNRPTHLALVCPVTNRSKGYPFEVRIPGAVAIQGVVLADQLKSLDWQARKAEFAGRLDAATLAEVVGKVMALVSVDED